MILEKVLKLFWLALKILSCSNTWNSINNVFLSKTFKSWLFLNDSILMLSQRTCKCFPKIVRSIFWNLFFLNTFLKIFLKRLGNSFGNLFPLLIICHDISNKLLFLLKNLVISKLLTEFVLLSFFYLFKIFNW